MRIGRKKRIAANMIYLTVIFMILLCIMFLYVDYSAQIPFKLLFDVMLIQFVAFMIMVRRVRVSICFAKGNLIYNDENAEILFKMNKRSIFPFKNMEYAGSKMCIKMQTVDFKLLKYFKQEDLL